MTDLKLATLLCSRICHDLVSPVGAINNGLEIMEDDDDPAMREEAMGLIRRSAALASAKLQIMRIAFGAAGSMSEAVPLDEPRTLTQALLEPNNIDLNWVAADVTLDKEIVRLLMNFVLLGFESLPRGGVLRVGVRKEGAINLMISAEGPKARMADATVAVLTQGAPIGELEPRLASAYLAHQVAKNFGSTVLCRVEEDVVQIAATI